MREWERTCVRGSRRRAHVPPTKGDHDEVLQPATSVLLRRRSAHADDVSLRARCRRADRRPPQYCLLPTTVSQAHRSLSLSRRARIGAECPLGWYWLADLCRRVLAPREQSRLAGMDAAAAGWCQTGRQPEP